nr:unnamed protein product [Spirometra erinaceieuropaei]
MGSPLSGFIAEAVLQKVETLVFSTYKPKFWARYVDDTFVIIERQMVKEFHDVLKSVFPDIQFTMEAEANNQLPFLDVLVHRKPNGHLKTTLTDDQIKVLQHESGYNAGDAHPADFIAAFEATLSKAKTTEDTKNSIRQRVASLIISHKPRRTISSAEVKAIKELKMDEDIVIVPADKGRATVILDNSEYVAKAQ